MVICLERGANDLHMVQLMPLPTHMGWSPMSVDYNFSTFRCFQRKSHTATEASRSSSFSALTLLFGSFDP